MVRLSAHRRNIFADLGNQSEKLKICQSTFERVSGETFAWLWLGFSDPSNAYWMVSENQGAATAFVR
jgi:hypothetical protein